MYDILVDSQQVVKGWSSDKMYDRLVSSQQVVKGLSTDAMFGRLVNWKQLSGSKGHQLMELMISWSTDVMNDRPVIRQLVDGWSTDIMYITSGVNGLGSRIVKY